MQHKFTRVGYSNHLCSSYQQHYVAGYVKLLFIFFILANTPVYDIVFALSATGQARFDLQKSLVENVMNFPSTAERKYGLIQYGPTANIRSRLEEFKNDQSFLQTVNGLTLPNSKFVDITSVLNLAPDLFRSSATDSNKILVLFTDSQLPDDVSALATAARDLNGRDIKVVVVNTGVIPADHSNWLQIPSLVVNSDPRISNRRRTVYQIGTLVYRGK